MSEDALPQLHLCVGVSVHGRDHGSAVPQHHVPLRRRPDLAGSHPPLHARPVRPGAADPHLHPPGPEQRQTPRPAAAHPAARSHCQVRAGMFVCGDAVGSSSCAPCQTGTCPHQWCVGVCVCMHSPSVCVCLNRLLPASSWM